MADRRRDQEFTEFARAVQHQMYRRAYLLAGDRETALDLVQTTLVKLYVAWSRVDQPAAYAQRVLVRTFLADRRRSRRERDLHTPVDPGRAPEDPARALTVLAALAQLPPRTRAVVVLRYWEDLSVEHTAAALGCSTGNVKSLSSRGLALLHDLLGETFEDLTTTRGAHR